MEKLNSLNGLPDEARLWIFMCQARIDEGLLPVVEEKLEAFLSHWHAHRRELAAGYSILENRFLVVAVDQSETLASGCSIDDLNRFVVKTCAELGIALARHSDVFYRVGEDIGVCTRAEFAQKVSSGEVGAKSQVFDFTLEVLGQLRKGELVKSFSSSWHSQAFLD